MNCMHLMDVIDPYPLVLRRPQPPSQADIWMDEEFKELRSQRAPKTPPWDAMHKEHRELTKEEILKGSGAKKWEGSWDAPAPKKKNTGVWLRAIERAPLSMGHYRTRWVRPGWGEAPSIRYFGPRGWELLISQGKSQMLGSQNLQYLEWWYDYTE